MHKRDGSEKRVAYIVQELIPCGELFDYIKNCGSFSEPLARYYFKQMFSGLLHIYTRGFSHRDLKPENILLDANYNIKIVDFGFACKISGRDGTGFNNSTVGTPGYMAPEIIERKRYQGHVADIFSLGVILFCLVVGYPPFEYAMEDDPYYKYIYINRIDLFWKVH